MEKKSSQKYEIKTEPNYLDPSKPFREDPADDRRTTDNKRARWAIAKSEWLRKLYTAESTKEDER